MAPLDIQLLYSNKQNSLTSTSAARPQTPAGITQTNPSSADKLKLHLIQSSPCQTPPSTVPAHRQLGAVGCTTSMPAVDWLGYGGGRGQGRAQAGQGQEQGHVQKHEQWQGQWKAWGYERCRGRGRDTVYLTVPCSLAKTCPLLLYPALREATKPETMGHCHCLPPHLALLLRQIQGAR